MDERPGRREAARRRLPRIYALALELRDAGVSEAEIAQHLDIESEALGPLFQVAEAKLAAICESLPPEDE
ncbi:MAG: hypothetical protein GEU78_14140 [Actinobacteria bacterium]|nr:hypothetical protein [Actinomycetota bacterium]